MRSIVSPLSGIRSPFGLRDGVSVYAILGFDPALVFDFKGDYFRKGSSASTFGASITHAATTNATMVDSDGLLKWRPHNRVTSSGDLTGTGWSAVRATYDGPTETLTQVGTTVYGIVTQAAASLTIGARYKYTIRMKAGNTGWGVVGHVMNASAWVKTWFDLSNGIVGTGRAGTTATIVSAGDGWWDCSVEAVANRTSADISAQTAASNGGVNAVDGDTLLVRQVHAFRSDLGGMVNNPDTGDSYVPTTTTPVYLSRRGHHIYNGDAWVNEGILHESEARTNLFEYSNDFTASSWQTGVTLTPNDAVSPDGTSNASLFPFSSSGYFQAPLSRTIGQTYTVSAWVKSYDGTDEAFQLYGENGTLSQNFVATSEWQRFSFTYTATTNNASVGDGIARPTTNALADVYVYGMQVEAGATPSSYIPTTSATVTRAADTLTVPAANLPYNSTNMSIQMDGTMTYADTGISSEVRPYRWFLDVNNNILADISTSGSRTGQAIFKQTQTSSGLDQVSGTTTSFSAGTNVPFNLAGRYGSTFLNGAHGGTLLTANTTPTALPDLSSTDLNLGQIFMGTIGQFRMWDGDITDAGITEAST